MKYPVLWRSLYLLIFVLGMYSFVHVDTSIARMSGIALIILALNELFEPRKYV